MHEDLRAVTFDCWGTLIYEPQREAGELARREIFKPDLRKHGIEVTETQRLRVWSTQCAEDRACGENEPGGGYANFHRADLERAAERSQ